jgi:hypothetical protein
VPAPAVIPALVVYFKVVAVKTLVVDLRVDTSVRHWSDTALVISYYGGEAMGDCGLGI